MPIDFTFTDEQEHIRRTVREFAEKFIAPKVFEMEQKERTPDEIIKEMAKLGLFGVSIPEEYGGLNLDPVTAGVIVEDVRYEVGHIFAHDGLLAYSNRDLFQSVNCFIECP